MNYLSNLTIGSTVVVSMGECNCKGLCAHTDLVLSTVSDVMGDLFLAEGTVYSRFTGLPVDASVRSFVLDPEYSAKARYLLLTKDQEELEIDALRHVGVDLELIALRIAMIDEELDELEKGFATMV